MTVRGADAEAVRAQFHAVADAEGERIPMYARLCRVIADRPELHELLLEAPVGQRLPVLLLAAIHDVVLRDPETPLGRWFPTVTGVEPPATDPADALRATVADHRDGIVELVRTRQVQTNEVNRCVAWWVGLRHLCSTDPAPALPLAIVELGASAGLNLRLDAYAHRFDAGDESRTAGRAGSPVQLSTTLRTGPWPEVTGPLPPIVARVGIDQRPVDPTDEADARWLRACIWPEQRVRQERLAAALALAAADPPEVVRGDLLDDLAGVVQRVTDRASEPVHLVGLSSWVLAYLPRERRADLHSELVELAAPITAGGGRLSLLTLEADHVLPWMAAPPLADDAAADERYASILAATTFHPGPGEGSSAVALARCQAHAFWIDRL